MRTIELLATLIIQSDFNRQPTRGWR